MAQSSEAGIRQGIGSTSKVLAYDEFDSAENRTAILRLLRTASRSQKRYMGTANQDEGGKSYGLNHICWVAGCESGLFSQPDENRFIKFSLLKPLPGEKGLLLHPHDSVLGKLGQKLLACAITHAIEAVGLVSGLGDSAKTQADRRTIESYSAPAAILGALMKTPQEWLQSWLDQDTESTSEQESDHQHLLDDILSCQVDLGSGARMAISAVLGSTEDFPRYCKRLEAYGIAIRKDRSKPRQPDALFVAHRIVLKELLDRTEWKGTRIDQVLLRIPGSFRHLCKCSRKNTKGILIPLDPIPLGEHDDDPSF